MRTSTPLTRLIALVVVVVLVLTLGTPARAEADVLTVVAIVSLALTGVILIAYLIIANVTEAQRAEEGRIIWVAMPMPAPAETP